MSVTVTVLEARSDARGSTFKLQLPFERLSESHVATLDAGQVRGNHFHLRGRELLTVVHRDAWSLHFDAGQGTEVQHREFHGSGAVQLDIPSGIGHAIRNDGRQELVLFVISDVPRDDRASDTSSRRIV